MVSDIIISQAGLHHCTGGVAFRKVADCMRLQYARIPCILPLTASMFNWKFTINNLDSDGRDHMQYTDDAVKDIYIVYDLGDRHGMLKIRISDL